MTIREPAAIDELRRVLDHLPDGVIVHRGGVVRYANPAAAALVGVASPGELVGRRALDLVHPEDRPVAQARMERALRLGELGPLRAERILRADGAVALAEILAIPFDTAEGRCVLAVARDVTERERRAARAEAEHRSAALVRLIEGLGHLLNNPLTGLVDRLERLQDLVDEVADIDEERCQVVRDVLGEAHEEAQRIARALQAVRDMVRPDVTPRGESSPAEAARMAATLLRERFGPDVRLRLELQQVPPVRGNLGKLTEMLAELLVNAVTACRRRPGSGPHQVSLQVRREGRRAVLAVEDDGPGIPPQLRDRIFEPFVTSRRDGHLGLGLSRLKRTAEALGGSVRVDSRPGRTRVELRLPLARQDAPPQGRRRNGPAPQARILVVDDEPLVGRTFERLLGTEHLVTCCEDGQRALELLSRRNDFDLLFVDVVMPGVDGISLYRELRARQPELARRVVFITGGAFAEGAAAFLEETEQPVLYKPFELRTVRAMVDRAVRGESLAAPGQG